ncbi:hypothetical protein AVEN_123738-1 [Araneus ventricosus]|uniref:Uncharacterized protein n=1 Tax=Araneus ventricosus TaxID=182803 RepID=A0A4Y2BMX7_ARAVE|nr:hypothetical protein AVEN_123738-1 [Araneus ventricosus]
MLQKLQTRLMKGMAKSKEQRLLTIPYPKWLFCYCAAGKTDDCPVFIGYRIVLFVYGVWFAFENIKANSQKCSSKHLPCKLWSLFPELAQQLINQ